MKSYCGALLLLLSMVAGEGQGIFTFNPRLGAGTNFVVNATVTLVDGFGPGPAMLAGVYLVREGQLELLQTTPFRYRPGDIQEREIAKYAQPVSVVIPGIPAYEPATVRARVWPVGYPTYEAALQAGACCGEYPTVSGTGEIYIPQLGWVPPAGGAPIISPNLLGLLPLTLPCVFAKGSTTNVIPAIKLIAQPATNTVPLEVLTGFGRKTNILQASTNLNAWFNVATNVPSTNKFLIQDGLSLQGRPRFYRAVVPDE